MNFLLTFARRPVLASVVALVVLLLGLQALVGLQIRQYPETTSTTINVATPYIGANAELVRGFITTPLESAISTADGIDYVESSSTQGTSLITARLQLDFNPNEAVAQILTKINQVSNQLPAQAENSVLTVTTGEEGAAMYLAFTSDVLTPSEITDYLNRAVRPRLETAQGVQQASVQGASALAMRIWLDPRRMAALGVTPGQVRQALATQNTLAAVGDTKGSTLAIAFQADTTLEDAESFRRLVVRERNDTLVRLSDVADVTLGSESYDSSVIFDGTPAVFMAVQITPEANLLSTVESVRALFPDIQDQLPQGLTGLIVYDSTVAVQDSISQVVSALVQALVIVGVIIFLFLGSIRSALVPVVAMPLAIVGAFFLMQIMGFSINLLTLLALILAIGTVVDDGIVISENAMRHIDEGMDPKEAAELTLRELAGSIVAMNIVVLAVFAPIGFIGGLTGALFTEFAYTVAAATLISGIVALTVSPMMCAQLLKRDSSEKSGPSKWVDDGFQWLSDRYSRGLAAALDARKIVLAVGGVVLVSVYFLYSAAESELAPAEDEGFMIVSATGDPNGSIDQLERWTAQLGDIVRKSPAVEHAFVISGGGQPGSGSNSAFGGVVLKPWDDREATQQGLEKQFQGQVAQVAGLQSVVISPASLPGSGGGAPVQMVISSIDSPRAVAEATQPLLQAARESGLFTFVESDLKFDKVQERIEIDRQKAAALGIDVSQLGLDLSTMLSGGYVNYFTLDGRSYRVIPQVARQFRLRPDQILNYYIAVQPDGAGSRAQLVAGGADAAAAGAGSGDVAPPQDRLIPLSSVVSLERTTEPRQLARFNQLNAAVLTGVPAPGVSLGEAVQFLQGEADSLPANYVVDWTGRSRQFVNESSALALAFGLAVVLMYLVLAAQYESFRDPAVMFLSIPMALAGALVFFALGVVTVNIYTQIGLLALVSSIIRHGILLVEFANDMQEDEGLNRRDAIMKAASLRLRAIIMTTVATVIGLVPLLFFGGSGPGAASRFAISFTLGVGMLIGTAFTLFVVPALYTVLAKQRSANGEDQDDERTEMEPEPERATG